MKYDISKISNLNVDKGNFKNFEKICFSIIKEDFLKFKESSLYEKNKKNVELFARNKVLNLMLSLAKDEGIHSNYQFQIFNIKDFEAFYDLYKTQETIDIKEMKGDYTYNHCSNNFDDWFIFGTAPIKSLFRDFESFKFNRKKLKPSDLKKDVFTPDDKIKSSRSSDDIFTIFTNAIYFEESNSIYYFYDDGIIYKSFRTGDVILHLNGDEIFDFELKHL